MNVIVLCEFSGAVRDAFARKGHRVMSCDLLDTEIPGPHYKGCLFDLDYSGADLVIAHPPCTKLAVSGNRHHANTEGRMQAAEFIWKVWNLPVNKLCIENPVGVINTLLPDMPKPQYIQPYEFGHDASKKTGLWLRGLSKLKATEEVRPRYVNNMPRWGNQTDGGHNKLSPGPNRWKDRSRTYAGIASAMAEQWGAI